MGPGMSRREFVAGVTIAALSSGQAIASKSRAAAEEGTEIVASYDVTLNVNGVDHRLTLDSRVTLLDALRDHLGLTGTKKGCDQGTCGACTVMVNGRRIDSCLTLAVMHAGDSITTIEGLGAQGDLHPVQAAFIEHDGFQCGFCTPGQIVSAVALLHEGRELDRESIRQQMSGNICRCGCYPHIVDAIEQVGGKR
jgi:xanthine dehydrogenase YagT iron-sulfur-binding subunit